jgi:hypothetical protein
MSGFYFPVASVFTFYWNKCILRFAKCKSYFIGCQLFFDFFKIFFENFFQILSDVGVVFSFACYSRTHSRRRAVAMFSPQSRLLGLGVLIVTFQSRLLGLWVTSVRFLPCPSTIFLLTSQRHTSLTGIIQPGNKKGLTITDYLRL